MRWDLEINGEFVAMELSLDEDKLLLSDSSNRLQIQTRILSDVGGLRHIVALVNNRPLELFYRRDANDPLTVHYGGAKLTCRRTDAYSHQTAGQKKNALKDGEVRTVIPGKIVETMVKTGDQVDENQTLLIIEAMKMENEIRAPREGTVKNIFVKVGDSVEANAPLLKITSV